MPIYSGIDEAGLGPILGPFCASLTTFESPSPLKPLLEDQQKKLFYVDDSKKVYQGKKGLERLEENVLIFYKIFTGSIPEDLQTFIPSLKSTWYKERLPLPIVANKNKISDQAHMITELFDQRGIKLIDIKRTAVSAKDFNLLIDSIDNKSLVCQKIIEPLIIKTFSHNNSTTVVDKQGGRKFYREYLSNLFPQTEIETVLEEDKASHYRGDNKSICYRAKADSTSFPVALASMFSKYMREISMNSFNRYWYSKNSGVKPTAGYYTDGVRFLKDLEVNKLLPENIDLIRRKK